MLCFVCLSARCATRSPWWRAMTSNSAVRTFHTSLARRIVDKRASIDVLSSGGRSASNSAQNSRIVVMLAAG